MTLKIIKALKKLCTFLIIFFSIHQVISRVKITQTAAKVKRAMRDRGWHLIRVNRIEPKAKFILIFNSVWVGFYNLIRLILKSVWVGLAGNRTC